MVLGCNHGIEKMGRDKRQLDRLPSAKGYDPSACGGKHLGLGYINDSSKGLGHLGKILHRNKNQTARHQNQNGAEDKGQVNGNSSTLVNKS
jgi:hypothetical protein